MKLKKMGLEIMTYVLVLGGFLCAAILGSRAVTVVSQMVPVEREHIIIIDPGHGGEDGGATSCTGVPESRFNLEIAHRLEDLLHLLGYDTLMTRETDVSIYTQGDTIAGKKASDLKERVRIVNSQENALLVSIHQNLFPDSRYSGAQVFYSSTEDSDELAKAMQARFVQTINPGSNRQAKKAEGIYLMQHVNCTGILIECGFLSNPQEEAALRSVDYQQKLCCVIATGLTEFLTR